MNHRKISQEKTHKHNDRILFKKPCKYIGSVAVSLSNSDDRQRYVNEKLLEMKDVGKGVSVILMVTDEGVKVLKDNESAVKMAHGITRIAFSTCQPERKLFAYVAKSLSVSKTVIIQAHMFKTKKNSHSQQLSSHLSKAFKIAYNRDSSRRKNRVRLFENEAAEQKVVSTIQNRGKRWAKVEIARGHDFSGHAMNARYSESDKSAEIKIGSQVSDSSLNEDVSGSDAEINSVEVNTSSDSSIPITDNYIPASKTAESENNERKKIVSKSSGSADDVLFFDGVCGENGDKNTQHITPISSISDGIVDRSDGYQNVVLSKDGYVISDEVFVPEAANVQSDNSMASENTEEAKTSPVLVNQRIRMDPSRFTMTEDELLKDSEWFQAGFSREIAETILNNRSVGSFFIRDSLSHPGNYVMSVRVPPTRMKPHGVGHFLVEQVDSNYFRIKGFSMQFPSLSDLVAHYGTVQEDIPVQLRLANDNPLFFRRLYIDQPDNVNKSNNDEEGNKDNEDEEEDFDDEYDDPDYENFTSNIEIQKELQLIRE